MKRLALLLTVITIAISLITACTYPMDSQRTATPESPLELCYLTVVVEPSEGGHVRHSGGGGEGQFRFASGEVVEFMAVPAEGYQFDCWSGDLSGETETPRLVMDGDKQVIAHFSRAETAVGTFALRVEADPPGGGQVRPESSTYQNGEVVSVTAIAAEGYQFDYWRGDLSGESDTSRLVMDGNKQVVAHFSRVEAVPATYTLRVEVDPSGAGYTRPESGEYASGNVVTITAVAAKGYEFDYWSGHLSGVSDISRLVMDGDKRAIAHFKRSSAEGR